MQKKTKKMYFFLTVITSIAAMLTLTSCRTMTSPKSDVKSTVAAEPAPGTFIGCSPSASECRYSCPSRNGVGIENDPQCKDDGHQMDVGCYCPDREGVAPIDLSEFDFISCQRSGSECHSLCRGRRLVVNPNDERCKSEGHAVMGCYCAKKG